MTLREHWDRAYETKGPQDVSWYQARPELSLSMIATSRLKKDAAIIDIGGGASTLVDHLLEEGYTNLTVLDVSPVALAHAQRRLGERASRVRWIEADATGFAPPVRYSLWHDRAAFHFLTSPTDRLAYVNSLKRALEPGGTVILATFAADGPTRCSGLDVTRYDETALARVMSPDFRLVDSSSETHVTPWGAQQKFAYFRLRSR
jgi:SAM-dependent methyltransferase